MRIGHVESPVDAVEAKDGGVFRSHVRMATLAARFGRSPALPVEQALAGVGQRYNVSWPLDSVNINLTNLSICTALYMLYRICQFIEFINSMEFCFEFITSIRSFVEFRN